MPDGAIHFYRVSVSSNDGSVDVEQSRSMERRLKRSGKDVRYIEFEGGDHHLNNYRHRLSFLKEMEGFLAGCLQR